MAEEVSAGSGGGSSSERGEINGVGLASMDSLESRWVFQDEDDSEIDDDDDDVRHRAGVDSEDEDTPEQRSIRTGPRIDSFDVEALEVPDAHRSDYEDFGIGRRITLAFQTLGVVFGDVGTSLLDTFSVMFSKAPINGNEDVIGALSLVLYTLILIPLVKYVLVVLSANNDGEVMLDVPNQVPIHELYHAKVSLLPSQLPSDTRISSFWLKVLSPELERSLKIKERLETSLTLKKLLLMLVLAGTSMVIADGVVTPALSVMSTVGGLKVGVAAIEQGTQLRPGMHLEVVFCVQQGLRQCLHIFATFLCHQFSLHFSCIALPVVGLSGSYLMGNPNGAEEAFFSSIPSGMFWPLLLIANIAALIASRTMTTATFSCIKQSIALGHFPRLKIIHTSRKFMVQIYIPVINWFLLVVCLIFVCSISSINEIRNAYGIAELGIMMMTSILVTIVMLLVWQINIIIALSFVIFFLGLELTFFSSVLWSVTDGSWII